MSRIPSQSHAVTEAAPRADESPSVPTTPGSLQRESREPDDREPPYFEPRDLEPRDLEPNEFEHELFEPPFRRRAVWVRITLTVAGVVLVLGGIALGPVPVIPGFPLVIAGALMLAASNATARRGMNRLEHALPQSMRARLRKLLRRPRARRDTVPPAP